MAKLKRWLKFFVLGGRRNFQKTLDGLKTYDEVQNFYSNLYKVYGGAPLNYMVNKTFEKLLKLNR